MAGSYIYLLSPVQTIPNVYCCKPYRSNSMFSHSALTSSVPKLKYLALNPALHFADVVRDAHAIVLAGGTMQPMSDFTDFLFPNRFGKPLESYACSHVIPHENVTALVVPRAPNGRVIKCTKEARKDSLMVCLCAVFSSLDFRQLIALFGFF